MFEAFQIQTVIDGLGRRIVALSAWDEHLIASLGDGGLLILKPQRSPDEGGDAAKAWQVVKAHRSADKQAMRQIQPMVAKPVLISLTDEGIQLHSLPTMLLKFQAMGTRGATCFAWQEASATLAVAVRRRLLFFTLSGSDLISKGEAVLPDLAVTMTWAGRGSLFVGCKKSYVLYRPGEGGTVAGPPPIEVAQPGPSTAPCIAMMMPPPLHLGSSPSSTPGTRISSTSPLTTTLSTSMTLPGVSGNGGIRGNRGSAASSRTDIVDSLDTTADNRVTNNGSPIGPPDTVSSDPALCSPATSDVALTTTTSAAVEVLLACGNSVMFFGEDGKPLKKAPIVFPEPLSRFSCGRRYVVGVLASSGAVEARGLLRVDRERATQTLRLWSAPCSSSSTSFSSSTSKGETKAQHNASVQESKLQSHDSLAAADLSGALTSSPQAAAAVSDAISVVDASSGEVNVFVALGEAGVRKLAPVPLADQALALATQGEYHQALALANLIAEEQAVNEAAEIHYVKGLSTGMGPIGDDTATVTEPRLSSETKYSAALLERRLRLMYGHHLFASGHYDEGMAQMALCSGTGPLLLLRLFPFLVSPADRRLLPQEDPPGVPLPVAEEPRADARPAVVSSLLPYLLSHRTRALNHETDSGLDPDPCPPRPHPPHHGSTVQDGEGPETRAEEEKGEGGLISRQALLRIIDTAIVKVMVLMPDTGALLRFVQNPNFIDIGDAVDVLTQHGMYAELAALYRRNGRHQEGLELLRRLSQEPASLEVPPRGAAADLPGLPGVWAAIRYLVSLTEEEAALIRNHSGWILGADPEAGLQAFLQMQPPLSPALVLSILGDASPDLSALYLEAALHMGLALPQEYHNELLLIYLQELQLQQLRLGQQQQQQLQQQQHLHQTQSTPAVSQTQGPSSDAPSLAQLPQLLAGVFSASGASPDNRLFPDLPPGDAATVMTTTAIGTPSTAGRWRPSFAGRSLASSVATSPTKSPAGSVPASPGAGGEAATRAAANPFSLSDASSVRAATASAAVSDFGGHTRREPEDLYRRLRDLACSSPWIDPQYVLTQLPQGQLLEVEALMLERLGRYREAIGKLVKGLGDLSLAEALCDRIYALQIQSQAALGEGDGGPSVKRLLPTTLVRPSDIYILLLEVVAEWVTERQQGSVDTGGALLLASENPFPAPAHQAAGAAGKHLGKGGKGKGKKAEDGDASEKPESGIPAAVASTIKTPGIPPGAPAASSASSTTAPWRDLAWLLSRKRLRIDAPDLLSRLPDEVPLSDLLPLIGGGMLSSASEQRRALQVAGHLRRSEVLSAREAAATERRRRAVHAPERACCMCFRRIGNTVVVAYPDGSLGHYLCHKQHHRDSSSGGGAPPLAS